MIAELAADRPVRSPGRGEAARIDGSASRPVRRSTVSAAEVACALATGQFPPSPEAADDSELAGDSTGPRNGTEIGTCRGPLARNRRARAACRRSGRG